MLPRKTWFIDDAVFMGCNSLTEVVLPEKLENIGACAFEECYFLEKIVLPKGIELVEWHAFRECRSLTIYCRDTELPKEWEPEWDLGVKEVVWGYKGE